jgi:hypothetical protein
MAKSKSNGNKAAGKNASKAKPSAMSSALRDAGDKAAELAQNPVARSMLAAGLVTAAAALTANKKVRSSVVEAGRDAQEAVEETADNASKIGAAIVTAATDAVRRLLSLGRGTGGETGGDAQTNSASEPASASEKATRTGKSSTGGAKSGGRAKAASSAPGTTAKSGTTKPRSKAAAKPAAAKSGRAKTAKAEGASAKPSPAKSGKDAGTKGRGKKSGGDGASGASA